MASPEHQLIVQENGEDPTPRNKKFIIVSLAVLNLVLGINFAILAPFYPEEAGKKGVSTAMVGFTFGEFQLIQFLISPIVGILLPRFGAKFVCISGIFLCGTTCILFGLLAYCPPGTPFLVMTLLVRGIMAVGTSMEMTASFAIIAATFPDNVSAMFGLLETFSGIGLMIGPPVGGALYQLGGFVFPFAVMGSIITLAVPLTMYTLKFNSPISQTKTTGFLSLLINPHIVVAALVLWGSAVVIGFQDPVLQPFLRKNFKLNHFVVGFVFIIGPTIYAFSSPVYGYFCDKKPIVKYLLCLSPILTGMSLLFLNPSPLFHLGPPRLWITILALVLFGLGEGAAFAPVTKDLVSESLMMGHKDDFGTFSLVSGFINACQSLGYFSGPMLSGILTGKYGFAWSSTIMGFMILVIALIYLSYTIIFMFILGGRHRVMPAHTNDEQQPILSAT